jgi:uncharacterized protein
MLIGVISDIHDHKKNLNKAINLLNSKKIKQTFFLGDLTNLNTLKEFQKLNAGIKAVFGNADRKKEEILNYIKNNKLNIKYPENRLTWNIKLNSKKIAASHGDNKQILQNLLKNNFDYLFTGHTHDPKIEKKGSTIWINPGSIAGYTGLDKKSVKPSFALINLKTNQAEIKYI